MTEQHIADLTACVADASRVITNPQIVQRLSRDFYWYSPILKKQLDDKTAEIAIQPVSVDEILRVLSYCNQHEIAVTVRGAGTGNYGQAIPLQGGVVLDLGGMQTIEQITEDGVAICEPGVRLGVLEAAARDAGWELRCYPSTVVKAAVGGFLGGGSGGIGSISHGGLRDFETVRAIEVVTMEDPPRVVLHQGEAVHDVLHAWGSNGIITKVWLALTPAVEWAQCSIAFDTFDQAFTFAEQVAVSAAWTKRLVTVFEWPIPSAFAPIASITRAGKALIFFMIAASQLEMLKSAAIEASGEITLAAPFTGLRTVPLLSDYTWNHTTLWAIKQDQSFTYLQCGFNPATVREQFAALKEKFGDEILFHIEFSKNGAGIIVPGAIPVVRFSTEERLNEMIDFCRSIGVGVANPHVNNVEGGGRYREDNVQLLTKYKYDPKGLLNPGKMVTFERIAEPEASATV
jgi:FAD/FMN-containing dehydrogenase